MLYALEKAHPEYEITALARNSDSGAKVAAVYPKIRFVYGDLDNLDDLELLAEESAKADIVIRKLPDVIDTYVFQLTPRGYRRFIGSRRCR